MASLYRCLRRQVCSLALSGIHSHGGCGAHHFACLFACLILAEVWSACLGYCPPSGVIIPRVMDYALPLEPLPYDPQKAKQLLAEAAEDAHGDLVYTLTRPWSDETTGINSHFGNCWRSWRRWSRCHAAIWYGMGAVWRRTVVCAVRSRRRRVNRAWRGRGDDRVASLEPLQAAPAAPAARPQLPVLSVPCGAWRLGHALVGCSPGGRREGCGPTPGAVTSGSRVAWSGRMRSVEKAV
jgi:hypothetical protein